MRLFEAIDSLDTFTLNESLVDDYKTGRDKFKEIWKSAGPSNARREFYKAIGYGDKPKVVSNDEFNELSKGKDILTRTEEVNQHERFLNGDYEHSTLVNSMYGTGIYFTLDEKGSSYYRKSGQITFNAILDNAKVISTDDIKEIRKNIERVEDIDSIILADYGILASILGYDALYIKEENYMLVMNRGKLIVTDGLVNEEMI